MPALLAVRTLGQGLQLSVVCVGTDSMTSTADSFQFDRSGVADILLRKAIIFS